MDAFYPFIFPV